MLTKYQRMEAKIERVVELEYKQLTNEEIDQDTYNELARDIDKWAREMYNDMER